MKEIKFAQEQIKSILAQIAVEEDGYNQVLKLAMEALMQGERMLYNELVEDVSNGYRPCKTFGRGKILELRVPRIREVLAIVNFPTESAMGWEEVLGDIKARGVERIDLLVCDGLTGIKKAIGRHYGMAKIQLCTVHLARTLQKYVKPKDKAALGQERISNIAIRACSHDPKGLPKKNTLYENKNTLHTFLGQYHCLHRNVFSTRGICLVFE